MRHDGRAFDFFEEVVQTIPHGGKWNGRKQLPGLKQFHQQTPIPTTWTPRDPGLTPPRDVPSMRLTTIRVDGHTRLLVVESRVGLVGDAPCALRQKLVLSSKRDAKTRCEGRRKSRDVSLDQDTCSVVCDYSGPDSIGIRGPVHHEPTSANHSPQGASAMTRRRRDRLSKRMGSYRHRSSHQDTTWMDLAVCK